MEASKFRRTGVLASLPAGAAVGAGVAPTGSGSKLVSLASLSGPGSHAEGVKNAVDFIDRDNARSVERVAYLALRTPWPANQVSVLEYLADARMPTSLLQPAGLPWLACSSACLLAADASGSS